MLHSGSPMDNQFIHYQAPSVPYSFINTDNLWNKSERPSICGSSFPSVTPTLTLMLLPPLFTVGDGNPRAM
jgi:hypothetical protein